MTVRPPSYLSGGRAVETPQSALDYEIAQEKASTLGRLGRRLEQALADLRRFDAERGEAPAAEERGALVRAAGSALWHLVVQREVLGFRDNAGLMRDYAVPAEVRAQAGIAVAIPPLRRRPPRG